MTTSPTMLGVQLREFLAAHDLSIEKFDVTGLNVSELERIAHDHKAKMPALTDVANYVANTLQRVPKVHSVKVRLKSPEGLIAKIIRKKIDDPGRVINLGNYETEITDLIGGRALHLFKAEWKSISDFIRGQWEQHEDPIAYFRDGDSPEVVEAFKSAELRTEKHKAGYRSVHHTVNCSPGRDKHLVEIQVRTIFEEGWSEIDHIVRYPGKTADKELQSLLMLFNSFAGNADSMGTFLMTLREHLEHLKARADTANAALQDTISKLNISEAERAQLRDEVTKLRTATTATQSAYITPNAGVLKFTEQANVTLLLSNLLSTTPITKKCSKGHTFEVPLDSASTLTIGHPCPTCGERVI